MSDYTSIKLCLMELKMWLRQPLNSVYHIPPINYNRTTLGHISADRDSSGLLRKQTVIMTITQSSVASRATLVMNSRGMVLHVLFSLHLYVKD